MKSVFDVILLVALPASGKSEIRNFMANIKPADLQKEFHIGKSLQLDDFPYVNFMGKIDVELAKRGLKRFYGKPNGGTFVDGKVYGILTELLNEDYHDLMNRVTVDTDRPAEYLFQRIDNASMIAGMEPQLILLPKETRSSLVEALNTEAVKIIAEKEGQYPESFKNRTIVIECARGGKSGSKMPLTGTSGYQYYLKNLTPDLLDHAAILYIWVTPEESRRKNAERFDPNAPDSSLFHCTPAEVMLKDYGCDDMQYLLEHSEQKDTVTVCAHGKTWHIPAGVIDNRDDMTSFLRKNKTEWNKNCVEKISGELRKAVAVMWRNYSKD